MYSKRKFKVGDRAWRFDQMHRPEQFCPYCVDGIEGRFYTMVHYVGNHRAWELPVSFDKAERKGSAWYTDQERDDELWMRANRHSIASAVSMCRDIATLRQVAELICWKATK